MKSVLRKIAGVALVAALVLSVIGCAQPAAGGENNGGGDAGGEDLPDGKWVLVEKNKSITYSIYGSTSTDNCDVWKIKIPNGITQIDVKMEKIIDGRPYSSTYPKGVGDSFAENSVLGEFKSDRCFYLNVFTKNNPVYNEDDGGTICVMCKIEGLPDFTFWCDNCYQYNPS